MSGLTEAESHEIRALLQKGGLPPEDERVFTDALHDFEQSRGMLSGHEGLPPAPAERFESATPGTTEAVLPEQDTPTTNAAKVQRILENNQRVPQKGLMGSLKQFATESVPEAFMAATTPANVGGAMLGVTEQHVGPLDAGPRAEPQTLLGGAAYSGLGGPGGLLFQGMPPGSMDALRDTPGYAVGSVGGSMSPFSLPGRVERAVGGALGPTSGRIRGALGAAAAGAAGDAVGLGISATAQDRLPDELDATGMGVGAGLRALGGAGAANTRALRDELVTPDALPLRQLEETQGGLGFFGDVFLPPGGERARQEAMTGRLSMEQVAATRAAGPMTDELISRTGRMDDEYRAAKDRFYETAGDQRVEPNALVDELQNIIESRKYDSGDALPWLSQGLRNKLNQMVEVSAPAQRPAAGGGRTMTLAQAKQLGLSVPGTTQVFPGSQGHVIPGRAPERGGELPGSGGYTIPGRAPEQVAGVPEWTDPITLKQRSAIPGFADPGVPDIRVPGAPGGRAQRGLDPLTLAERPLDPGVPDIRVPGAPGGSSSRSLDPLTGRELSDEELWVTVKPTPMSPQQLERIRGELQDLANFRPQDMPEGMFSQLEGAIRTDRRGFSWPEAMGEPPPPAMVRTSRPGGGGTVESQAEGWPAVHQHYSDELEDVQTVRSRLGITGSAPTRESILGSMESAVARYGDGSPEVMATERALRRIAERAHNSTDLLRALDDLSAVNAAKRLRLPDGIGSSALMQRGARFFNGPGRVAAAAGPPIGRGAAQSGGVFREPDQVIDPRDHAAVTRQLLGLGP